MIFFHRTREVRDSTEYTTLTFIKCVRKTNINIFFYLFLFCRDYALVSLDEASAFMQRSMVAAGAKPSHAKDLSALLTCADYRGHFSHGMNRLSKCNH